MHVQEIALSNTDCGATIEEVEAHLKAHDAFQNLVAQQEEKVGTITLWKLFLCDIRYRYR